MTSKTDPEKFSVSAKHDPSIEIVGLRAELKVWLASAPNEYPDEFLQTFDALAADVRPTANWYKNYNMTEFKPATAKAWTSPRTWLTRGKQNVARSFMAFEHPSELGAGHRVIHFQYHPVGDLYEDSNTSYLRQVLPHEELAADPQAFLDRTLEVAAALPFLCGHCGYSLEISRAMREEGEPKAYALGMRHHGLNLHTDLATWRLRDARALDTINWLTLVGAEPLEILGGRDAVVSRLGEHPEITVHDVDHGIVVQAGDAPQIGDSNRGDDLPVYRAVYAALRPALELHLDWNSAFRLGGADPKDRTERWHKRLA